jgi:hypothetical protein
MIISSGSQFSVPSSMSDQAVFGTKRSSGTFGNGSSAYMATTTGYCSVIWWDGVKTVYGSGNKSSLIAITKAVVAPYNTGSEKLFTVYSCDSGGKRKGFITSAQFNVDAFTVISSIDIQKCRAIQSLSVSSSSLTSYTHNKNLLGLTLIAGITSLDVSGSTKLSALYVDAPITSLNITSTILNTLDLYNTSITTITGLSSIASTLTASVISSNSSLTSLDFSNFTALQNLLIPDNRAIASIRASNVSINFISSASISSFYGGITIINCNLNAAALNQLYTDLANGNGRIQVSGNPGTASDTPSIATAKGYTVLGS